MQHGSDGGSGTRPAVKTVGQGAAITGRLLQGTLASLRCRELIDEGAYEEARVELLFLYAALGEIDTTLGEGARPEDVENLRFRAARLAQSLERARGSVCWWKAS